jgi:four helix bundle protein
MSRDHTKLRVFRLADRLVLETYRVSRTFPDEERYELRRQLRRAAVSVACNLVEGSARRTARECVNFFNIALGSACESRYLLDLTARLYPVAPASWQASVAMFLEGKLSAGGLLSKANTPGLQTEAHAYIGIKAHIDGDDAAALRHLTWVKDKGQRNYTEYRLALGELDRIASKN